MAVERGSLCMGIFPRCALNCPFPKWFLRLQCKCTWTAWAKHLDYLLGSIKTLLSCKSTFLKRLYQPISMHVCLGNSRSINGKLDLNQWFKPISSLGDLNYWFKSPWFKSVRQSNNAGTGEQGGLELWEQSWLGRWEEQKRRYWDLETRQRPTLPRNMS